MSITARLINVIDRKKLFSNASVEKQVNILNDTIIKIFSNFVRSKVITVDNKKSPMDKWKD